MDHPGALRHPADREAVAQRHRELRPRVRGQDRLGCVVAAVRRERVRCGQYSGHEHVHRQVDADHAGREHHDLFRSETKRAPGGGCSLLRVGDSLRAGSRVGDAGVDHHRLRLGRLEMPLRDEHRSCQHPVHGPHRAAHGRSGGAHEGHVRPGAPDTRVDAGGKEPRRGGDAHTRTRTVAAPRSRRSRTAR